MVSLNKMFVNYKGTKVQFEAVKANYANQIVFIDGGKCIYAKGAYYGSVEEAISGLKYFTSIKVGEKVASAPDNKGVITFAADTEASIVLDVDARGITIGLSEATKAAIEAAAVKVDVDADIEALEAAIKVLEEANEAFETRVKANEDNITAIQDELDSLSGGAGSIQTQIDNTIARLDLANTYEAKGAAAQALVDAKVYVDENIYDDSALAGRVEVIEGAIEVLNGENDGSVKKQVADAIAGVVASAPEDFDTLKEIADYIASDKTGAAELNNAISANATAIADEKSRAELAESGLDTKITNLDSAYKAADEALAGRVEVLETAKGTLEGAIAEKVSQADYDAKIVELAKADSDNLAAAKADAAEKYQVKGNYETAGAAAQALVDAKAYTDTLANGAVATNAAAIKVNQDDLDAIEAFLNNPWLEVNA